MADVPPANTAQHKRKYSDFESSQAEQRNARPPRGIDGPAVPQSRISYLTRLAPELLREIFSYFEHPHLYENRIHVEDIDVPLPAPDLHALQNSRLACSRLNQIATPLLLPILRVEVNKESLDRVEGIAKNELLCSGVRGIQILMSCRLRSFALDRSDFITFQQTTMNDLLDQQSTGLALMVARGENESHQLALDHRAAKDSPSYDRTRACLLACGRILGSGAPLPPIRSMPSLRGHGSGFREAIVGLVPPTLIDQYHHLLNCAYRDYRRDYERDLPVVSEGLLVKALAEIVSKPTRSVSLSFSETLGAEDTEEIFADQKTTVMWLKSPTRPSECRRYQQYLHREDMAPYTALFSDLPIAIHQKGSSLNSLELHGPMLDLHHSILCPGGGSSTSHALVLNQLQMALQNLDTFIIPDLYVVQPTRRGPFGIRRIEERPSGGINIAQYLSAVLSSGNLQRLELNPSPSSGANAIFEQPRPSEIGYALSQVNYKNLCIINLANIHIAQPEFEAFCTSWSPEIDFLGLTGILLTQGSWVPILDLLRDKCRERFAEGICQVEIDHLQGGELEQMFMNLQGDLSSFLADFFNQITRYVQADEVHRNPLLDLGPF